MAIKHCICKNEYQDRRYGAGMRVANALGKDAASNRRSTENFRCTSCGKDITPAVTFKKLKKVDDQDRKGKKKK